MVVIKLCRLLETQQKELGTFESSLLSNDFFIKDGPVVPHEERTGNSDIGQTEIYGSLCSDFLGKSERYGF